MATRPVVRRRVSGAAWKAMRAKPTTAVTMPEKKARLSGDSVWVENAGPDQVGGKARDAYHAGGETDPVTFLARCSRMHGNDHAGESCDDGHGLLPGQAFAQEVMAESSDVTMGVMKTRM